VAKAALMSKSWDVAGARDAERAEADTPAAPAYRPEGCRRVRHAARRLYRLSDDQAQEILQMRLQRLTGLEQDKIVGEYKEVMAEIADLLDILAKPERVTTIIADELTR
jgi:DNA gyrase subunit A